MDAGPRQETGLSWWSNGLLIQEAPFSLFRRNFFPCIRFRRRNQAAWTFQIFHKSFAVGSVPLHSRSDSRSSFSCQMGNGKTIRCPNSLLLRNPLRMPRSTMLRNRTASMPRAFRPIHRPTKALIAASGPRQAFLCSGFWVSRKIGALTLGRLWLTPCFAVSPWLQSLPEGGKEFPVVISLPVRAADGEMPEKPQQDRINHSSLDAEKAARAAGMVAQRWSAPVRFPPGPCSSGGPRRSIRWYVPSMRTCAGQVNFRATN
jgi:hypothetical protein